MEMIPSYAHINSGMTATSDDQHRTAVLLIAGLHSLYIARGQSTQTSKRTKSSPFAAKLSVFL